MSHARKTGSMNTISNSKMEELAFTSVTEQRAYQKWVDGLHHKHKNKKEPNRRVLDLCTNQQMKKTRETKLTELGALLSECLDSGNQNGNWKVIAFDETKNKLIVEFDVVEIPQDDYIGFEGY